MAQPDGSQASAAAFVQARPRRSWTILLLANFFIMVAAVLISMAVGRRFGCVGNGSEDFGDSVDPFCAFNYVPIGVAVAVGVMFVLVPLAAWFWRGRQGTQNALIAAGISSAVVGLLWVGRIFGSA